MGARDRLSFAENLAQELHWRIDHPTPPAPGWGGARRGRGEGAGLLFQHQSVTGGYLHICP